MTEISLMWNPFKSDLKEMRSGEQARAPAAA
eukprot:CAMPEP_0185574456 /NCGR_PEP_ID=MMETSP0434-20130131/5930_1 /TAXON_ID=626734 ORGANISM="Favella taraikaensis, Strain Fe Narragansett Bay" /NCGR_SAMPLE_ID=MMETSP0434 /ASSEMBLY_ACC=CAM_ASM_000379 /LENGTH=30 /DNA_ID= /DNA_START= /DNA_END= /DNA_ORIENTATION=